jgi:uncharacterized protein YggE
MKTLLLALAAAFATPLAFAQQAPPSQPLVTTSGSAQIRVIPDLADLYFEVEVRDADLMAARKQHSERVTKILAVLRAAGVAETELQASQVQISPNYTNNREETEKLKYYSVSQSISCTLHNVKKIPDVTTDVLVAGATSVRDANLRTTQHRKYRDEARIKAIQAAKEKASALAAALGDKITAPFSIDEETGSDWRSSGGINLNTSNFAGFSTESAAPEDGIMPAFAPGTISISANVRVAFVLEPNGR